MIKIKKLPSGKLSFKMNYMDGESIANHLMSYLETESVNLMRVRIDQDPTRWLLYYVLDQFFRKHSGKMLGTRHEYNYVLDRSESLAIMYMLRDVKNGATISAAFELKTALHQKLS
jgi:hypothetical protein